MQGDATLVAALTCKLLEVGIPEYPVIHGSTGGVEKLRLWLFREGWWRPLPANQHRILNYRMDARAPRPNQQPIATNWKPEFQAGDQSPLKALQLISPAHLRAPDEAERMRKSGQNKAQGPSDKTPAIWFLTLLRPYGISCSRMMFVPRDHIYGTSLTDDFCLQHMQRYHTLPPFPLLSLSGMDDFHHFFYPLNCHDIQ